MEKESFLCPENKKPVKQLLPCPFSASSMQKPSEMQPPPMYGPRGPTIPPKHLGQYNRDNQTLGQPRQFSPMNYGPRGARHHRGQFNRNQRFRHPSPYQTKPFFRPPNVSKGQQSHTANFYCETCDRDLVTSDQFDVHRSEHRICSIDGCPFEAHELILKKHIQEQHNSGLYDKLKNLSTPEDIEKWRAERRKRYPTKQNIELRQQAKEAQAKRGERLEISKSRFGRKTDRRNPAGKVQNDKDPKKKQTKRRRRRRHDKNDGKEQQTEQKEGQQENDEATNEIFKGTLKWFEGTSLMVDYKRPNELGKSKENALTGLLGMYGSSESDDSEIGSDDSADESDRDNNETEPSKSLSPEVQEPIENINLDEVDEDQPLLVQNENGEELSSPICKIEIEMSSEKNEIIDPDDGPPDEYPVERQTQSEKIDESHQSKDKPQISKIANHKRQIPNDNATNIKSKQPTLIDLSKKYRNQNTMLEKLLQKEIRHERNVLLQCVRYVVQNNFFRAEKD